MQIAKLYAKIIHPYFLGSCLQTYRMALYNSFYLPVLGMPIHRNTSFCRLLPVLQLP